MAIASFVRCVAFLTAAVVAGLAPAIALAPQSAPCDCEAESESLAGWRNCYASCEDGEEEEKGAAVIEVEALRWAGFSSGPPLRGIVRKRSKMISDSSALLAGGALVALLDVGAMNGPKSISPPIIADNDAEPIPVAGTLTRGTREHGSQTPIGWGFGGR